MKHLALTNAAIHLLTVTALGPTTAALAMEETALTERSGGSIGGRAYVRSTLGSPFGATANEEAMDLAFGTGQWDDLRLEEVDPLVLFSDRYSFVYLEGGDLTTIPFATFIQSNHSTIESWVDAGGGLLLNAAPNSPDVWGDRYLGFTGVQLHSPNFSASPVSAGDPLHPIWRGRHLPTSTTMNGFTLALATVSGSGLVPLIVDADGVPLLSELSWGDGRVVFGGLRPWIYWEPAADGHRLMANLLSYIDQPPPAVYIRSAFLGPPFGLPSHEDSLDQVFGPGGWFDLRYNSLDVGTPGVDRLFSPDNRFLYLEGSEDHIDELTSFLAQHQSELENWVAAGGGLMINAALTGFPPSGAWGFGGVQIDWASPTYPTYAVDPQHPIWLGPELPTPQQFIQSASASISGPGLTPLIDDANDDVFAAMKEWGEGRVLFGGLLPAEAWIPSGPPAYNLRSNMFYHLTHSPLFIDGFESGTTTAWSSTSP